jgi:hypothetical protein
MMMSDTDAACMAIAFAFCAKAKNNKKKSSEPAPLLLLIILLLLSPPPPQNCRLFSFPS